jgi:pimeloyl-ACP methyl ester carboxylesterase
MSKATMDDLVVVLPGITGSILSKGGVDVWNLSARTAWSAAVSRGGSIRSLRLENDNDPDADLAPDGVRATGMIEDLIVVPGLFKLDGYSMLPQALDEAFELAPCDADDDQAGNFLKFPYDWRRDVRFTARRLKKVVDRKLGLWRRKGGTTGSRVVLVAHSMGGLVAQYYLEALGGWADCRALITFGTPYRGAVQAIEYLVHGYKMLRVDLTETMRSFPSTYQLLPRYPAIVTEAGGKPKRVSELVDQLRLDAAGVRAHVALHAELDAAWDRNKADERYRNEGYLTIPVIGTKQPTLLSAVWDGAALTTGRSLPPGQEGLAAAGDGTVPQVSAIPLSQSSSKDFHGYFVAGRHETLQNQAFVLGDLIERLKLLQSPKLADVWGELTTPAQGGSLSVDIDDIYASDEPIVLRAAAPDAPPGITPGLVARVERADGAAPPSTVPLAPGEAGVSSAMLPGLAPGVYRVEIGAAGAAAARYHPVQAVFEVDASGDDGRGRS